MVQVPNLSIYRSIKVLFASFPLPWSCSHFLITFERVKFWEFSVRATLKLRPFPSCHYTEVVRKETACEYLHSFRKFWIIQMIYHESHPRVYHSCPDNSCIDPGCALLAPKNRCMHQLKMAVCVQPTQQAGNQIGSRLSPQKLFFTALPTLPSFRG